jgi:hypothetical protein
MPTPTEQNTVQARILERIRNYELGIENYRKGNEGRLKP